jgi:hypothetical protein
MQSATAPTSSPAAAAFAAAEDDDWALVHDALDAGAVGPGCVGPNGATLLHIAARRGHAPTLARLLAAGGDVNAPAALGPRWTPLHHAAFYSSAAVLRLVCEAAGADVNAPARDGEVPLQLAATRSAYDLQPLRYLLSVPTVRCRRMRTHHPSITLMQAHCVRARVAHRPSASANVHGRAMSPCPCAPPCCTPTA